MDGQLAWRMAVCGDLPAPVRRYHAARLVQLAHESQQNGGMDLTGVAAERFCLQCSCPLQAGVSCRVRVVPRRNALPAVAAAHPDVTNMRAVTCLLCDATEWYPAVTRADQQARRRVCAATVKARAKKVVDAGPTKREKKNRASKDRKKARQGALKAMLAGTQATSRAQRGGDTASNLQAFLSSLQ